MPSYKLTYFDARGRAEIVRLLFAYGGVEYEDSRIQGEAWEQFKPKTPFGQMPVLEVDGKIFGQTLAIANYVAREIGLYGKTNLDALAIDQVMGVIVDFIADTISVLMEKDEEKKVELMKKYKEEISPKHLGFLEKLLNNNGTGFFVGSEITLADIGVYDFNSAMQDRVPGFLDNFPVAKAHLERIGANPKIKAYVETRKPATS